MASEFLNIYDELIQIRKYLIKKGQSRYKGSIASNKLSEAENCCDRARQLFSNVKLDEKSELVTRVTAAYDKIKSLFLEISELCSSPSVLKTDTMEFDLRTACNLIPILDGKEATVKRLIDAVEMYGEMLNSSEKSLLIKFVLKSRLSENAKLRLSDNYSSIEDLVKDLKKHLLTTKSYTAIQSRLLHTKQSWRSIDEFGTELEKLFSELTITQAECDSDKYSVLKPMNEKMAIKVFSDGLNGSRLSTIVAARNFSCLKDAIQAAKDEQMATPSTSTGVMQFSRRGGRGKYQSSFRQAPRPRGSQYNTYNNRFQRHGRPLQNGSYNNYYNRGSNKPFQNHNRGRSFRNSRRGNWHGNTRNVLSAQLTSEDSAQNSSMVQGTQNVNNQFFRD